jgi:hypothetical protein
MPSPTKEQVKNAWLARFDLQVVRLEDELVRFIKLISTQVDALQNELANALKPGGEVSSPEFLRKLKDLGATFNSATDAQVRLVKTEKDRAKTFSPEQERAAVEVYVKALPADDRARLLQKLVKYHNELGGKMHEPSDG